MLEHSEYTFGEYHLTQDGELSHKGTSIEIPPKELTLLRLFLKSNGSLLSKDDIIREVWCGVVVSDESLTRCIYGLRRILGSNKHYVRTFYARGYRFSPPKINKKTIRNKGERLNNIALLHYNTLHYNYFNNEVGITYSIKGLQ